MRLDPVPDVGLLPSDPSAGVDRLLGPDAAALVSEVLGRRVASVRAVGASYRPGRSLTVRYRTTSPEREVILGVGRTGHPGVGEVAEGVIGWPLNDDPWLPGLALALAPGAVAELLAEAGLRPGAESSSLVRRAYRPTRRAVVEVGSGDGRVFLKVVRPESAAALADKHRRLATSAPVPALLGCWPEPGIVALAAVEGRTVRDVLRTTGPLPTGRHLFDLLDALPSPDAALEPRAAAAPLPGWRSAEHARHLAALVPEWAGRLENLAAAVAAVGERRLGEAPSAVHGDLYEAQVIMRGGQIAGLVDVDTYGWGHRVDDLGSYIGHLAVLATVWPKSAERIGAHQRRVLAAFERAVDPAVLRARVAASILGLATGPFRVLDRNWAAHTRRRIELAERWLDLV